MQAIWVSILRSRGTGYLSAVLGIASVIAIGMPPLDQLNNTSGALALLLVVLFVATGWRRGPGMAASVLGMLGSNFFFVPPVYTLTIADPQLLHANQSPADLPAYLEAQEQAGAAFNDPRD